MWEHDPQQIQNVVIKAERLGLAVVRNGRVDEARGLPFSLIDEIMTPLAIGHLKTLDNYIRGLVETRVLH